MVSRYYPSQGGGGGRGGEGKGTVIKDTVYGSSIVPLLQYAVVSFPSKMHRYCSIVYVLSDKLVVAKSTEC